MISSMSKMMICIARALLSLIFLFSGAEKFINWQETVDVLITTFSSWYMHLEGAMISSKMHEFLVNSASTLLGIATFLEITGALFLLLGFKIRWGALLLLLFLIPTTVIFHPFWFEIGADMHGELRVFLKNLALIGAFLYLLVAPQPCQLSQ